MLSHGHRPVDQRFVIRVQGAMSDINADESGDRLSRLRTISARSVILVAEISTGIGSLADLCYGPESDMIAWWNQIKSPDLSIASTRDVCSARGADHIDGPLQKQHRVN